MISILGSAVKHYGFTESRKCQLRKLVEKGKSGKKKNCFYISPLIARVCNVHITYLSCDKNVTF